ncbi:MAG: HORMA domain containing protein [Solirubrobacteraceae bacterium]
MSTFAFVNTYAYSVTHLSDNMLRGLQELIRELGLSPKKFADDWKSSDLAISTWLSSRHLNKLALEIYDPSKPSKAILVPEFDIVYGSDADEDGSFWVDSDALRYEILKAGVLPSQCTYSLVCFNKPGRPEVDGWGAVDSRSREGMTRYVAGRTIGAPGLSANSAYWARA